MRIKKPTNEQEIELLWEELDKLTEIVKQISDNLQALLDTQPKLYLTAEGYRAYDGEKWV